MYDDEFEDTLDEDMILALAQATDAAAAAAAAPPTAPTRSVPAASSRGTASAPRLQAFRAPAANSHSNNNGNGSRSRLGEPTRGTQRSPTQTQKFRQTTLWGSTLQEDQRVAPSQPTSSRPFRADLPPEVPTHHELNRHELATWVYPLNLGPIRDYQFSIVKNGLFHNTLVALPTGLGKTFIAATVMLNFFRWTKRAKIIFVAPTKPLAAQQVQACLNVAGIPRSQATLLTGETAPALRAEEWKSKRLFFMTPQTLLNDLSKGWALPKSIVLLVIDEAHRATGDYAYVKVVEFMRRFSQSFRVLALTATPGSTVEGVQDIINNLGISHVEIRTEESIDIRQYVHSRSIDTVTFEPSDEMLEVMNLFSKALKPLVDKLSAQNIYYGRDPMSLTTYGLLKARQEWMAGPGRHAAQGLKMMMMGVFGILQSLAHSIKLLNFHGIKPFYNFLVEFRATEEGKPGQGSKLRRQLLGDDNFQKMMSTIEGWMKLPAFNGHPKLAYLCETLVNHFVDAGENSATRAIVFSEYRDSAEEIVRLLNNQPLISATVFVGQADTKRSEGMKQKQQIETIAKFRDGTFNVLVATSIGEEGLDIGQVDLIVCYDASSSPIRMLQRMGRTGRKRAGNIVLLLMKGKEEDKFAEAKDNYQRMQQLICNGDSFEFRHDLSTRIIPRDIRPEVDKRHVDIPIENSQDPSLPEPTKTPGRLRKKPPQKVFNMPDGVETGFIKASLFGRPIVQAGNKPPRKLVEADFLADVPELHSVLLSKSQTDTLERVYKSLPSRSSSSSGRVEHIEDLRLDAYPAGQRALRPTVHLKHGEYTRRCVRLLRTLGKLQRPSERYTHPYGETDTTDWQALPVKPFAEDSSDGEAAAQRKKRRSEDCHDAPRGKKRPVVPRTSSSIRTGRRGRTGPGFLSDCEEADEDEDEDEGIVAGIEPTPQGARGRVRPQARRRGGKKTAPRRGDHDRHLEDIGDDCTRTSDMEKTEDSDSGADLADFVVGDDEDVDVFMSSSSTITVTHHHHHHHKSSTGTGPTTPGSSGLGVMGHDKSEKAGQSTGGERPFFEPMVFGPTQDTDGDDDDDEMPDVDELVARSASAKKAGTLRVNSRASATMRLHGDDGDGDGSDDTLPRLSQRRPAAAAKRKRRMLADSSEDE